MKIHVLPGDALAGEFKETNLEGEIIVCRECLVEGDVSAETLEDFWQVRAQFITNSYVGVAEDYFTKVKNEFEKLSNFSGSKSEINLWFEYELFCQVNLWFCLFLLRNSETKIFRVAPVIRNESEIWKGFGGLNPDELKKCYNARVEFSQTDISHGANLWKAYQTSDFERLEALSEYESKAFPYLTEVCRAEILKNSRPKAVLQEIIEEGKTDFSEIFQEFSKRAGVYGLGDSQVKKILAEI